MFEALAEDEDPGRRARGPHLRARERVSARSPVPPQGGAPGPRRLAVRPPRCSWAGRRRTEHLPGAPCSGTGSPALGLCSP